MSELPLPTTLTDRVLNQTRSRLVKGARQVNRAWVDLEKLRSRRIRKGKKHVLGRKKNILKRKLESAFNPLVNEVFQQYNYSDFCLALLFFIQTEFGVQFKRSEASVLTGHLYGTTYDAWYKMEPQQVPVAQRPGRFIQKCSDFTIIEVPEKYQKEIRTRIIGHEFKSQKTKIDEPRSSGESLSERLKNLKPEERRLKPDEFFHATADFPDEDPGLINFSICRTDECTLKATKDDYKRFERTLESKSGHRLMYDRLELVFQLNPTRRYWGRNAYQGYTALEFYDCPKVLLTSPIYGNAVYILRKDEWRNLTNNYVKEEIRSKFPKQSTTFPHTDGWLHKVSRELKRENFS